MACRATAPAREPAFRPCPHRLPLSPGPALVRIPPQTSRVGCRAQRTTFTHPSGPVSEAALRSHLPCRPVWASAAANLRSPEGPLQRRRVLSSSRNGAQMVVACQSPAREAKSLIRSEGEDRERWEGEASSSSSRTDGRHYRVPEGVDCRPLAHSLRWGEALKVVDADAVVETERVSPGIQRQGRSSLVPVALDSQESRGEPSPPFPAVPAKSGMLLPGSPGEGKSEGSGVSGESAKVGRRSLALFLPLIAAVSATTRAAAEVATTVKAPTSPLDADVDTRESLVVPIPAPPALPPPRCPSRVRLNILEGSTLGVSFYPDFGYNPKGGGGTGTVEDVGDGKLWVHFDPGDLYIPPLSFDSTTFVGLPLPPPLRIKIVPSVLSGVIDKVTGQVDLNFKSKFYFTAGPIYSAPPLTVETTLTTESSIGSLREGQGQRLDRNGRGMLVAVAEVPPVNDGFLDRFLSLPTDVLALLSAQFTFDC